MVDAVPERSETMIRWIAIPLLAGASLFATTLEKMSVDAMIQKSTGIVRGTVVSSSSFQRGALIYTSYRLKVSERLKGQALDTIEVAVPGGVHGRLHQTIPGAPALSAGQEYVVFLWTNSKGLNLIIGLSQGLFNVNLDGQGTPRLSRTAAAVPMVDSSGRESADDAVAMSLRELSRRIKAQGETR